MSRPELLAALVAGMSPPSAREIVRAATRAFTGEEHAEWTRLLAAARQRKFKAAHPAKGNDEKPVAIVTEDQSSNAHTEGGIVTRNGKSNDAGYQSSVTPIPPSHTLPPAAAPAHTREANYPTEEQVMAYASGSLQGIPPKIAELYFLDRTRSDPTWHTPAKVAGGNPIPVGNWRNDLRAYSIRFRHFDDQALALQKARLLKIQTPYSGGGQSFCNGNGPPSDPTAGIDPAAFITFFRKKYPRLSQTFSLEGATPSELQEYREHQRNTP